MINEGAGSRSSAGEIWVSSHPLGPSAGLAPVTAACVSLSLQLGFQRDDGERDDKVELTGKPAAEDDKLQPVHTACLDEMKSRGLRARRS